MHDRTETLPPARDRRDPRVPLAYVRPGVLPRRPAVLTGIAAAGIAFAAASFVAHVFSLVFHAGLWWLEPPRPTVVPPAPIPAVSVEPYDGDPAGVDGLKRAERRAVVELVRRRAALPADRAEMLERLLADVGRRAFPRDVDLTNPTDDVVVESGRVDGPDGTGPRASHYFVTRRGRVELSDFTATFTLDGATTPVRVVRNVLYDGDAPPRWSAVAIGEGLEELHQVTRGMTTAEQASVIVRLFRERIPDEPTSWDVCPRVARVSDYDNPAWSFSITVKDAESWLLPDGRMIALAEAPEGIDLITGAPRVPVRPIVPRYWPGSRGAFALLAGLGLLGAILAAYLFIGAAMMLRDVPSAGERLVRYVMLQAPLLLVTAFALLWWRISLREFAATPPLAIDTASFVPLIIFGLLSFPLAVVAALHAPRVKRYFAAHGQDPWHPLRATRLSPVRRGAARTFGLALAVLASAHVVLAIWCDSSSTATTVQTLAHWLCAIATFGAAAFGLTAWRRARVATVAALGLMLIASPVSAQTTRNLISPWAADDLLAQARGADEQPAIEAVRKLARAGDGGQDALLRLLDGPVPPLGLEAVLVAIGQEWFDTDVRWTRANRPAALRLALEWAQVIEQADDARAMAVLEAMGPDERIEPLLRPLLTAESQPVRARAAQFLLRVNPRPASMIRALERDLTSAGGAERRQRLAEALVNIRPTSDATLARLMLDVEKPHRDAIVAALVQADAPYAPEMLAAAERLARRDDGYAYTAEMRLMRHTLEGRRLLIDLSFADLDASRAARDVLREVWPATAPLFRRLASDALPDRRAASAAAKRVLAALCDGAALEPLTDEGDDELRAQALIVHAGGSFAERLGPATLRMVNPTAPQAQPRWQGTSMTPNRTVPASPPPVWASALLCGATLVALFALLAPSFRREPAGG